MNNRIFVFGSNLAGRHGAGSALEAKKKHGAKQGYEHGWCGNSYAIPTKDKKLKTLPLSMIKIYVDRFIETAVKYPQYEFDIVAIGCGLAGYKPEDIAPMFKGAPSNCHLPAAFFDIVNQTER